LLTLKYFSSALAGEPSLFFPPWLVSIAEIGFIGPAVLVIGLVGDLFRRSYSRHHSAISAIKGLGNFKNIKNKAFNQVHGHTFADNNTQNFNVFGA